MSNSSELHGWCEFRVSRRNYVVLDFICNPTNTITRALAKDANRMGNYWGYDSYGELPSRSSMSLSSASMSLVEFCSWGWGVTVQSDVPFYFCLPNAMISSNQVEKELSAGRFKRWNFTWVGVHWPYHSTAAVRVHNNRTFGFDGRNFAFDFPYFIAFSPMTSSSILVTPFGFTSSGTKICFLTIRTTFAYPSNMKYRTPRPNIKVVKRVEYVLPLTSITDKAVIGWMSDDNILSFDESWRGYQPQYHSFADGME